MIWKATALHHVESVIYDLLGSITTNLLPECQNYLLQLIYSIPFAEYTPNTINLIAQMQNAYPTNPSSIETKVKKNRFSLIK